MQPRSIKRNHAAYRSKPHINYPSPFPEDNLYQVYSGSEQYKNDSTEDGKPKLQFSSHSVTKSRLRSRYPSAVLRPRNYPNPFDSNFPFDPRLYPGFSANYSGDLSNSPDLSGAPPIQYSSLKGPAFISNTREFSAVAGTTAILSCMIRNLHNYTVSRII